jgi:hypothetical protein
VLLNASFHTGLSVSYCTIFRVFSFLLANDNRGSLQFTKWFDWFTKWNQELWKKLK